MAEPACNRFVEGDNLDVLAALPDGGCEAGFEAGFELAYLDPPYNTGSAFAYHDRLGSAADPHGAWLAMMRPRLEGCRRVLARTGVIAVSIDDHEVAHLRLLLDELFGEANRLAQIVVNLNPKGRQLGHGFAVSHEYLLIYARDAARCVLDPSVPDTVDPGDFGHPTDDGRRFRLLPLRNTNKRFNPRTAATMAFALWGDPVTGRVGVEAFDGAQEVWPVFGDGAPAVWRWSAPRVTERPDDLVCRRVRGRLGERVDVFQRDWWHPERRKKLRTVWLADEVGSTDTAVAELTALVGKVFESPKPTGLIRRLLATLPDDARVLDPFAGSGTTGHAVALANAADGGTRTCLSIERSEPVRPGSHADVAGLATVADVTRLRLRAVAAQVGGGLELDPMRPGPARSRPPSPAP